MVRSPEGISEGEQSAAGPFNAKALADLSELDGPPEQFLTELLATQCRMADAEAAAILRSGPAEKLEILAAWPGTRGNGTALDWIRQVEKPFHGALKSGETAIVKEEPESQDNDDPRRYLMVIPILNRNVIRAVAAFRIKSENPHALLLSQARLETTPLLLDHHELRLATKIHHQTMHRLSHILDMLHAVNGSRRFLGAAMALCNEIATRLGCGRVSLGFLDGRCVKVRAMSHADGVNRRMQTVRAIEAAMEECLDQDVEVIYPATDTAVYASRAAARLSERHNHAAVLSLPIREDGDVLAVMTLERPPGRPFDRLEEIETVRLTCDLCAPRLLDLHRSDRWLGARLASEARQYPARILGPTHTWTKLGAVLVCLLILLLATMKGQNRINASFTFKARHHQMIVAPFDTFSKSILVEPGDSVEGGKTTLGTLETSELRLKLAARKAEQLGYQKQMMASMRDQKTADAQIARAQSDKVAAEIRLIEKKIEQAALVAPITGWVVSKDLKQRIGAPVEMGEILFEIASIDSLRAELYVPEASIAGIAEGQAGELASVGHPNRKVRFVIERINPIAEVVNHQNIFRVRARILEHLDWMRPGMEGQARIAAGEKNYLWIMSHRLVNWLRMKLWI